jgi:hypothetical protein
MVAVLALRFGASAGRSPLPKAVAPSEKAKSVARTFIAEHERRDTEAPHFEHHVSIVKGRSISQEEHEALVDSLGEGPAQIMSSQFWYPPIWDEFTHVRGHLDCGQLVADTRTRTIGDDVSTLQIAALAPAFMGSSYRQGHAYANDLRGRWLDSTGFVARARQRSSRAVYPRAAARADVRRVGGQSRGRCWQSTPPA